MDEYTPYCAICGGPIENPDVQRARVEMGDRLGSTWLSDAMLLRAEAVELPSVAVHQLPAKNEGGPKFQLSDTGEEITTCDVSGSILPSPRDLYLPCHAACTEIAEKVLADGAARSTSQDHASAPSTGVGESRWRLWRVLKARFEEASEGKFQPVTNIGVIHDYGGIRRFQGLAWEPGSDGILEEESQLFEADPLQVPNLTTAILSYLRPSTEKRQSYQCFSELPWLWDIDASAVIEKEREGGELDSGYAGWDWRMLCNELGNRPLWETNGFGDLLPAGVRNRCRIWRLVEDLLMESTGNADESGNQV